MSAIRSPAAAVLIALVCLAVPAESPAKDRDPALAITSQIICPCSCGEVLSGCTCDTGKSMQGFVERSLKAGKTKDEIVGALVSQYGEVIRGAPKPQGFNLIVWIAPFAATLAGLTIAFVILRRWARRSPAPAGRAGAPGAQEVFGGSSPGRTAEEDLEALRERAEAELRRLRR
ncbi:MAG: cytochrome c-type biogenesis protein CcmH [Candidatus Latescibacteria bacterium]|nr:cytochrome c-type biogenesis protein CcmH [Candidatus Latescibacterota bacterium]